LFWVWVGVPNVPAFVLGGIFTAIFAKYAPKGADFLPGTVGMHLGGAALSCVGVTAAATMLEPATAINVLGWGGTGVVIVMFAGYVEPPFAAVCTLVRRVCFTAS
jgi:hypothetical protein